MEDKYESNFFCYMNEFWIFGILGVLNTATWITENCDCDGNYVQPIH